MLYLYLGIIGIYLILWFLSRKEILDKSQELGKFLKPFEKMAVFLQRKTEKLLVKLSGKKQLRNRAVAKRQLANKFQTLFPSLSPEQEVDKFYLAQYSLALFVLFAGNLFCLLIYISNMSNTLLKEGTRISRNAYGQGSIPVHLTAQMQGEINDIEFEINEQELTEEEIEDYYESILQIIPEMVLGKNEGPDNITTNLELFDSVPGFPFAITWESDNYELLGSDGEVKNYDLTDSAIVVLTGVFQYHDYRYEYQIPMQINPHEYTKAEWTAKLIENAIRSQDELSKTEAELVLPSSIGAEPVVFIERVEDSSRYLMVLVLLSIVVIHFSKKQEVDQKLEIRRKQLLLDYPEIVNKLALYVGAGMTVRNAFFKIGEDYKKQEHTAVRYAYEEIILTCNEIRSGRSEMEAYDRFGRRCQIQKYIKLGTLLTQSIKKGSNDLIGILKQETREAFADRKNLAKKLGEEAGTKLLLPMMMMLCVVMIIIIVPAYFSFTL